MNSIKEEVTQADDRFAAAQWWNHYSYSTQNASKRDAALSAYLAGCSRSARHRLQSTSDLRAKAEGLAAQNEKLCRILARIVSQSRVGYGDKPVTSSKRVNYPGDLYHSAKAVLEDHLAKSCDEAWDQSQ